MLYEGRGNHFVCDLCKADLKETPKYALYFEAMSRCEFCPVHSLRSMKRNDKEAGKWAHITCITYMPGAYINKDGKTYHNGVNPKCYSRQCAFCRTKEGGVVYCKHRGCYTAFHVLCGRMHDCGHDGHRAMVLELGRRIRTKQALPHNILLLFQPAEETTGGARRLCETGVLERLRVKAVFALHLWPGLSAGMIAGLPGAMMARSAEVTFTAEGRCAHFCSAASGRDALAACVEFYSQAAALPLPQAPQSLLGFGRMEAGSVRNAVAGSARLEGSLRALDDAAFCSIQEALETISRHVAQTSGCAAAVHFSEGYPAVVNPPDLLRRASALFPIEALTAPTMASDDFSYYQRRLPGLFLFLGCGKTSALHTAAFDFDERVLETGVRYFEAVAGGAVW